MAEVEVIKASEGTVNRRRDTIGKGLTLERQRVAAYVRVSTDGEEQLQSFQSQMEYYTDKISKNKDWAFVGIYSDEAITGTKTAKREGFLNMISDCMNGLVDVVLTKSISRFSRNLVDTLQYVRMLKEKNVAIIFEKENINTLSMESEMALALLSTLAQNEVESLSANTKMGLKMKKKRGELLGFNGCLGYDYHQEDKSLSMNEEEAEIVWWIFNRYNQGYGAYTIANDLTRRGIKNKKGIVKWTDSGIRGIILNEKYKGDLLLGKTFTVDPLTKRRLDNMGEEDQFYIKNHHEAIVSEEEWNMAQEIRKSRYGKNTSIIEGTREKQSRKFAFSSMCECAYCGTKFSRRSHHQDTQHKKPVWVCRTAANKGKASCPDSKAIDESILENAFVESFQLLADNFDDILESVLESIEIELSSTDNSERLKRVDKSLATVEGKRKKLTDMLLDDKISKEAYDERFDEFTRKISQTKQEQQILIENEAAKKDVGKRMKEIRARISEVKVMDRFDRAVFESIVKKVIIGEVGDDGKSDPYKITFVLKGLADFSISDARKRYKNLHKQIS
ncbi:DNA invertase Pin-like site-specific DNA recombinase [Lachnotalea glycerini]|uniref:DNA invertase Pin-like site-specific DNA recombinase n=1 Tax=Lachnotalea glycerini TaxID=1763509 RepID=A0A318EJH0_9FIRM|nr:recombinase family protein [Lachnotalea glycerini]PXV87838.1 DNA invertase Pin-like site-specific DNA recombinase [Lachnotalea glycerini]